MARYKQNPNPPYNLIPIDGSAKRQSGAVVHGDIQPFVSPVDGSVISDRKQLREHNKWNNVVDAAEFTPEFYAGKAKERENFYLGRHTSAEKQARGEQINEIINQHERANR